jgi:hypothetical protein
VTLVPWTWSPPSRRMIAWLRLSRTQVHADDRGSLPLGMHRGSLLEYYRAPERAAVASARDFLPGNAHALSGRSPHRPLSLFMLVQSRRWKRILVAPPSRRRFPKRTGQHTDSSVTRAPQRSRGKRSASHTVLRRCVLRERGGLARSADRGPCGDGPPRRRRDGRTQLARLRRLPWAPGGTARGTVTAE